MWTLFHIEWTLSQVCERCLKYVNVVSYWMNLVSSMWTLSHIERTLSQVCERCLILNEPYLKSMNITVVLEDAHDVDNELKKSINYNDLSTF